MLCFLVVSMPAKLVFTQRVYQNFYGGEYQSYDDSTRPFETFFIMVSL